MGTFKRIVGVVVAIGIVWIAAVRLGAPSDERRAALDTLAEPIPAVAGRDGTDALWLLEYDVPVSEQAKVGQQLRRYFAATEAARVASPDEAAMPLADPRDAFPKFPPDADAEWLCRDVETDCLARIRGHVAEASATLEQHRRGLAAVDRLLDFDGVRFIATPNMDLLELPQNGRLRRLVRADYALQFVQGDHAGALARTCRDIHGWRRLGADTDNIITSMVAAAFVAQDLRLLGEMLAEMEAGEPLPAACDLALAPTRDAELGLCLAARTEFRTVANSVARPTGLRPVAKMLYGIAIDADHVMAVLAPAYARPCAPDALDGLRADKPYVEIDAPTCSWFERVGDPGGCWVAGQAPGDYFGDYIDRRTDQAARLALMRTVLWLRSEGLDAQSTAARVKARPASLGLRREPTVSQDARAISIPLLDTRKEARFTLPLVSAR